MLVVFLALVVFGLFLALPMACFVVFVQSDMKRRAKEIIREGVVVSDMDEVMRGLQILTGDREANRLWDQLDKIKNS